MRIFASYDVLSQSLGSVVWDMTAFVRANGTEMDQSRTSLSSCSGNVLSSFPLCSLKVSFIHDQGANKRYYDARAFECGGKGGWISNVGQY